MIQSENAKEAEPLNISNKAKEKACIMASIRDVQQMQRMRGNYSPITCTSYFQCSNCKTWCYKGKCSVACGHWHLLQLTHEEQADLRHNEAASINLMDHFQELVPNRTNGKVGLVTYQNGINNDFDNDFSKMGNLIRHHLKEGPLCIGLYNKSMSIAVDLCRLQCEFIGIRTEVVRSMRKMFATVSNRIKNTRPHPHWLHIAHSEGGRIAHDTLQGLSYESQAICLNHLIVHTYGSVQPISNRAAKTVINTYSTHDIAYKQYGAYYENRTDYKIKVTDSLTKPFLPIPGDHGFLGKTYQLALRDNFDIIRQEPGIYDAKS